MRQPVDHLLQQLRVELMAFERALARGRTDANAARRRLPALSKAISLVGSEAAQLERDVAQMRHFAYHDPLTTLPNRTLLLDRLDRALALAARQQRPLALLLLDLDEFKQVNDRFGHAVGDELLRRVAERLLTSTRHADTTCRYGGDEFVVLLLDIDGRKGAVDVARKIRACLDEPFAIGGRSIRIIASIGIALYPEDGNDPGTLLKRADLDMYAAKRQATPPRPVPVGNGDVAPGSRNDPAASRGMPMRAAELASVAKSDR